MQIVTVVFYFDLPIPPGILTIPQTAGSPVGQMSYSFDCFLLDFERNNGLSINIVYFRVIWSLITPVCYLLIFISLYIFLVLIKKAAWKISVISTTLIYLFIFLQPGLM